MNFHNALFIIWFLFFIISANSQSRLDVIVIDAGHGGKDPGTIGNEGQQEKNIVLPIALKFGQKISAKFPEVRVIYTRDKDEFPQLRDRTRIANENHAKLFISIHANHKKQEETTKNGFEIYILDRERFGEAVSVTMNENTALQFRKYGTDTMDNFIFFSLAETGYLKFSEMLASGVEVNLLKSTQLVSRGPQQAGLWVNVGSSMPSILIETGYIDDPKDVKFLISDSGQNAISTALFNAFSTYKNLYEMN